MDKKPLIVIAGPTAVGKSKAAVALAKEIGGEVISADSMQVYQYMDIGSAKITKAEMDGIPHHLLDVLDPKEPFNVTIFQRLAKDALQSVYDRGHVPIICGGTGFYIQSVLYDIDFTEHGEDQSYRQALEALAEREGAGVIRHYPFAVGYRLRRDVRRQQIPSLFQQNGGVPALAAADL